MSPLFGGRRRRRPERRPGWALRYDDEEWREFVAVVRRDLEARDVEATVVDGAVLRPGAPAVGLAHLARTCRGLDRAAWPEAAAGWFDRLLAPGADAVPRDLAAAVPRLRVRLYADDVVADPSILVARPAGDGLLWTLVLDGDDSVVALRPEDVALWDAEVDDLFAAGFRSVREERPEVVEHEVAGVTVVEVAGDSVYTGTHLRWLDELVPLPRTGALVALPSRHVILAHPLRDRSARAAPAALAALARERRDEDAPAGSAEDGWWWRDGGLELVPGVVRDDGEAALPPDLAAAIDALPDR